ncbi:hypothetical protein FNF29_04866 [Cafeteria roenbergensis]|uniref:Thioredoxin domain-containing protein n=1 Tax=Cafeteria roenbergensis TaxID=33653 RepID=A0A5A8CD59_CAFRO|nr:hypothetical protein FNF29_04866 [Cafeteria roenbergensis]|eukprot:KAA0150976.1 hypothetical protein FNF29_04866 [Cafeteria roenbergensis]
MSAVREVTSMQELEAAVGSCHDGQGLIICCSASWCGPCKAIKPEFEALSARHPDVLCLRAMDDTGPDVVAAMKIRGFPTFIAGTKSGGATFTETHRFSGADRSKLESTFASLAAASAASAPDPFSGAGRSLGALGGGGGGAKADMKAARLAAMERRRAADAAAREAPAAAAAAAPAPAPAAPAPAPAAPAPAPAAPAPPAGGERLFPNVQALVDMGFGVEAASLAIGYGGSLEGALDWLEARPDGKPLPGEAAPDAGDGAGGDGDGGDGDGDGYEDDGAEGGGGASGLSLAERKARVQRLIAEKKAAKAAEEKEAAKARELARREAGQRAAEAEAARAAAAKEVERRERQRDAQAAAKRKLIARLQVVQDQLERAKASGHADKVAELEAKIAALQGGHEHHAASGKFDPAAWQARLERAMGVLSKLDGERGRTAMATVKALVSNAMDPAKGGAGEEAGAKFRRVKADKPALRSRVTDVPGGRPLLMAAGWAAEFSAEAEAAGVSGAAAVDAFVFGGAPLTAEQAARLGRAAIEAIDAALAK